MQVHWKIWRALSEMGNLSCRLRLSEFPHQRAILFVDPVMRYTVSHSPFGYESDVGTSRLKYAVTDTRPDKVPVYIAADRARVLKTPLEASHYLACNVRPLPFRHVAFATTQEDADALANAMNRL